MDIHKLNDKSQKMTKIHSNEVSNEQLFMTV